MNPLRFPIILLTLLPLILSSCRVEQFFPSLGQGSSQQPPATGDDELSVPVSSRAAAPDSMLAVLRPLQGAVYTASVDTAARSALLAAAFDTASGSFLVVGKGVANPVAATESAAGAGRSRAAESDAKRWALYLKAWHTGSNLDFGSTIKGKIAYARQLAEHDTGDTLLQLWQVPIGSVEVEPE